MFLLSISSVQLFVTPWAAAHETSLSFALCPSSLKFMSTESGYYLTISSSATLLSFCLQSFPTSGSFPVSWLLASGGQRIGSSASVLLVNIQGCFPLGLTGLISLQSKGLLRVFSSTTVQKHQFFGAQPSLWSNSHIIHDYWKNQSFEHMDLCKQSNISVFEYTV